MYNPTDKIAFKKKYITCGAPAGTRSIYKAKKTKSQELLPALVLTLILLELNTLFGKEVLINKNKKTKSSYLRWY